MRLRVQEPGADAFSLNSWKCSLDTRASVSYEIFQVAGVERVRGGKPGKGYVTYTFSYFY